MNKLRTWWMLGIGGLVFIAIGIFSYVDPLSAYVKMVRYSGLAILMNGMLLLLASFFIHTSCKKEKNWILAESIIDFIFGILLFYNPFLSFIVFPFLIGYWVLCIGVLKIAASLSLKNDIFGWMFILVTGILSLIFGMLIIYTPFAKAEQMTLLIGVFAATTGALAIFDSIRFRKMEDTLNLMF